MDFFVSRYMTTFMSSEIINNQIVGLFRIVEIIDTFFLPVCIFVIAHVHYQSFLIIVSVSSWIIGNSSLYK